MKTFSTFVKSMFNLIYGTMKKLIKITVLTLLTLPYINSVSAQMESDKISNELSSNLWYKTNDKGSATVYQFTKDSMLVYRYTKSNISDEVTMSYEVYCYQLVNNGENSTIEFVRYWRRHLDLEFKASNNSGQIETLTKDKLVLKHAYKSGNDTHDYFKEFRAWRFSNSVSDIFRAHYKYYDKEFKDIRYNIQGVDCDASEVDKELIRLLRGNKNVYEKRVSNQDLGIEQLRKLNAGVSNSELKANLWYELSYHGNELMIYQFSQNKMTRYYYYKDSSSGEMIDVANEWSYYISDKKVSKFKEYEVSKEGVEKRARTLITKNKDDEVKLYDTYIFQDNVLLSEEHNLKNGCLKESRFKAFAWRGNSTPDDIYKAWVDGELNKKQEKKYPPTTPFYEMW